MKCPNCGYELKNNQNFCNNCGAKLNNEVEKDNDKNLELQAIVKYFLNKSKTSFMVFSVIILLVLVIFAGMNLFNHYKIRQALNNSSYNGNKILIVSSHKFSNEQKDVFCDLLKNKYGESVYIPIFKENKAVIYAPKNIDPENILSYLSKPVIKFKKKDNRGRWIDTGLNDKYLNKAEAKIAYNDKWIIVIEFGKEGKEKFAQLTKELTGKELGIFYNDELLSAPRINEQILGGVAQISTGDDSFTEKEVKKIANMLNLEKNIKIIEVK